MRSPVAFLAAAIVAIAGCSDDASSSSQCPDTYGSDYQEAYDAYVEAQEEAGNSVVDSDGDCVPDDYERRLGTDAENATSFPVGVPDFNATANNTQPPVVVYGPATGTVT